MRALNTKTWPYAPQGININNKIQKEFKRYKVMV